MDVVKSVKTHPTADAVYEILRKTEPNISLGTVYRNLNMLVSNNEINVLRTNDEKVRFDGDTSSHQHFICKQCGKIIDIYCDAEIPKILSDTGVLVEERQTVYYGKCLDCLTKDSDMQTHNS